MGLMGLMGEGKTRRHLVRETGGRGVGGVGRKWVGDWFETGLSVGFDNNISTVFGAREHPP